jgi:NADPH-dependent 2,4-dienoyl-CoA reductase/sulfur reductase-like enzyme
MIRHVDVLVVGAGPAGIAAATAVAQQGCDTVVLDDNHDAGGQIWRGGVEPPRIIKNLAKQRSIEALQASGAELLRGRRVVDAPATGVLRTVIDTDVGAQSESFAWDRLILATGARERFLPFPGWTLPGVFGAGGLQALVKGGFQVKGKRVVVAGTGPLLLAVAAHLREYGAKVVMIAEQASIAQLLPFALSLWSSPAKLLQAARVRAATAHVPYRTGCWPVAVDGDNCVRAVHLTDGKSTWREECELLACGFHLVPNTELGALLGCSFRGEFIEVNEHQETSIANVFCAGESTGIAGLDAALIEGEIAGLAAARVPQKSVLLHKQRDKEHAFASRLETAFRLRPELLTLAASDTIVCRCEDVSYAQLKGRSCWTEAKLMTRCGMGPCQGRICGPATETLFGWQPSSVRPPLFPVPIEVFQEEKTYAI